MGHGCRSTESSLLSDESNIGGDAHEHHVWRDGYGPEFERAFSNRRSAAKIPDHCCCDDGKFKQKRAVSGGQRGCKSLEVENESCRIDGHVKDGGREREPRLLKAPEWPKRPANPCVESAFGRYSGREFAEHESGWKAPEEWKEEDQ